MKLTDLKIRTFSIRKVAKGYLWGFNDISEDAHHSRTIREAAEYYHSSMKPNFWGKAPIELAGFDGIASLMPQAIERHFGRHLNKLGPLGK